MSSAGEIVVRVSVSCHRFYPTVRKARVSLTPGVGCGPPPTSALVPVREVAQALIQAGGDGPALWPAVRRRRCESNQIVTLLSRRRRGSHGQVAAVAARSGCSVLSGIIPVLDGGVYVALIAQPRCVAALKSSGRRLEIEWYRGHRCAGYGRSGRDALVFSGAARSPLARID